MEAHVTSRMAATLLLAVIAGCSSKPAPPPPPPPDPTVAEDHAVVIDEWRTKHENDYRRDWVTISALHILKPGANRAGSAATNDIVLPKSVPASIGQFVLKGEQVRFEPAPSSGVLLKGAPVKAAMDLKDDGVKDSDELTIGNVRLVVHATGERRSIRVRDPDSEQARNFKGFTWFPIDTKYRVIGKFIKDAEPKRLKVVNTVGDIDEYSTEGVVEFKMQGQMLRLRPFTTRPKRFYFVFRDASSGVETYDAARFLYADLLDDGTTLLDFNEAYNPPCAFNPFTTCPIPLKENRLPIKVLAGEKKY
jgi:uncharacterized protein